MSEYIIDCTPKMATDLRGYRRGQIVRCKECEFCLEGVGERLLCKTFAFNPPDDNQASHVNTFYPTVDPDSFCSWGERRDE